LDKWGVENVAQSKKIKEKTEKTNLKRYGTKSSFQNKDVREKFKRNYQEKHGVDHPFKNDEVKDKIKHSNNIKFGKDYYTQTDEFILKSKITNNLKFGKDYYTQTNEFKERLIKISNEKWGVDSYLQTDELRNILKDNKDLIIEKSKKTSLDNWGVEFYTQSEDYKNKSINFNRADQQKIRKTNLEKWGKEYYTQTDEWKENMIKHNQEKYGKDWYSQTDGFKDVIKLQIDKFKELKWIKSKEYYKNCGFELLSKKGEFVELVSDSCGHTFSIYRDTFYKRYGEYNINPCIICNPLNSGVSGLELEVVDWLKSLNINIETNNRSLIDGFELDIVIPDQKIAIEFNGLYWHSEFYKEKNYHSLKTDLCKNIGFRLIHIWEDDWKNKSEIVKSIILNSINKIDKKVWARKCNIKEVDSKSVRIFLDSNHIQGNCQSSLRYGLYLGDELISLMTFGSRYINGKSSYELLRFCNKIGYSIVGGASKLFSHFLKNCEESEIVSYADLSIFDGYLYKTLGFKFIHRSNINYWWVVNGKRHHRFNFSKKRLVKLGYDKSLTADSILHSIGAYKIFGCGQDRYVYKR
jgi:very-short-patch-repair endonuclease